MYKSIILVISILFALQVRALDTLVNKPNGSIRGLVVIAPAKKYLMQERLFSLLAETLASRGFLTVRFNWSSDTLQSPELELQRAARDIQSVTANAQRAFGFRPNQTVIVSKSFSTKALDPSLSLAKSHILLTPNCSAEAPFQQTYQSILEKSDVLLKMVISVDDPYCQVSEIYQTLKALGRPQLLATTLGDHNFVVLNSATGETSFASQDLVIKYVTNLVARSSRKQ